MQQFASSNVNDMEITHQFIKPLFRILLCFYITSILFSTNAHAESISEELLDAASKADNATYNAIHQALNVNYSIANAHLQQDKAAVNIYISINGDAPSAHSIEIEFISGTATHISKRYDAKQTQALLSGGSDKILLTDLPKQPATLTSPGSRRGRSG